ncbi:MAG TPA: DnaA N-terminal domain-containing protein [Anaerolineae bacterium]|nr:DnaA N-terminal domain-containing protein [Anaerolineae bacterium]
MRTMKETLHLLKGGRLHLLHALKYAQDSGRGAVGWQWLAEQTGYSKGGVMAALQALVTASPPLVQRVRHYEGWCLHVNALALPIFPEAFGGSVSGGTVGGASGKITPFVEEVGIEGRLVALDERLSAIEAHLSAVTGQSVASQPSTQSVYQPNYPSEDSFCPAPSDDGQVALVQEGQKVTATAANCPPSATFCPSSTTPTHHDHDHEMIINHDDDELDHELTELITELSTADDELIKRLTAIGFDQPRRRLASLPRYELAAWLLWWEWLPSERRGLIKRPAGFIRSRLQKGLWPDDLIGLWGAAASQPVPPGSSRQLVALPAILPEADETVVGRTVGEASGKIPAAREARIWQTALDELALQMTQATFNSWLADSRLVGAVEGVYTVLVRNEYAKDWLENRFKAMILRTLRVVAGGRVEVAFVTQ